MIDNLPVNPQEGDTYTSPKGVSYIFDGVKWKGNMVSTAARGDQGAAGPAGPQGPQGPVGPGIGNTIVQNTITLGAITTAPVVGARTVQRLESQLIGDKLKLIYKLGQVSSAAGSGDYLLTLPNNVAFNTTYHPLFTGLMWAGGVNVMAQYLIPAYGGIVIDSHWTNQIVVVPYDATRFRLAITNNNSQTTFQFWSNLWYATSAASGINLQLHFEIWPTTAPAAPPATAATPPVRATGLIRPPV